MDSTQNVPAQIQAEAKAKALAILNSEPGCISYVRPEDLETASLFVPVVSIIKPVREDFYDPIPEVGIMAKPPLVNLIREKAGINILRTETSKRGEYIWVGHCYGEKRMPDGTMEPQDASYEFDAEKRCKLDFISDTKGKYTTDIAKEKHLLKTAKFGDQRAVTGAQHTLVHKMAKIPRSFKTADELMHGMKVLRIDRNINGIMADPNMREAIINHALGATEQVFGPAKQIPHTVDPQTQEVIETSAAAQDAADQPSFPEIEPEAPKVAAEPELTPEQKLKEILKGYKGKIPATLVGNAKTGKTVHQLIDAMIGNEKATAENINSAIDWCADLLQKEQAAS